MPQEIYLLVGVPGAGKSWVCERAKHNYEVVQHDFHIHDHSGSYLSNIMQAADRAQNPILAETPFSISRIMEPLLDRGYSVTPVFIIENEKVLEDRWNSRDTSMSHRKGHLTRQDTYKERANEHQAFRGDSCEVLEHLNSLATKRDKP